MLRSNSTHASGSFCAESQLLGADFVRPQFDFIRCSVCVKAGRDARAELKPRILKSAVDEKAGKDFKV